MTNMPEAKLAREAELCYATLALATDYDVWHETHEVVSVEAVVQNLLKNVATAKQVLRRVIPAIAPPRVCECSSLLENAVITNPKAFPKATRKKLGLLLDPYFPRGRNRIPRERSQPAPAAGHPRSKPASRTPRP
jgi:5'-methylthioadenosine phosphorylase